MITFTNLPQSNSDFGSKTVRVKYKGQEKDSKEIKVYFPPLARNNPGPEPDDIPTAIDLREVVIKK